VLKCLFEQGNETLFSSKTSKTCTICAKKSPSHCTMLIIIVEEAKKEMNEKMLKDSFHDRSYS
jgi:hypothetical protein